MKNFSISIEELIKKPIIRNDKFPNFLNKMTDEEIKQFDKELDEILLEEKNIKENFDYQTEWLTKVINRDILYNLNL